MHCSVQKSNDNRFCETRSRAGWFLKIPLTSLPPSFWNASAKAGKPLVILGLEEAGA
jgi:hypothetical protein